MKIRIVVLIIVGFLGLAGFSSVDGGGSLPGAKLVVCNCSNQKKLDVTAFIVKAFNVLDEYSTKVILPQNKCEKISVPVDNLQTMQLIIGGAQNFFHIFPNDSLYVRVYNNDSISFISRGLGYTEYASKLPHLDIQHLYSYKNELPDGVYEFEKHRIEFIRLFFRMRNGTHEEKQHLIDSLNQKFAFNSPKYFSSPAYFYFLREYFYWKQEIEFGKLHKEYGTLSFDREVARELIFEAIYNASELASEKTKFMDSLRQAFEVAPLELAKQKLTGEILDRHISEYLIEQLKIGKLPQQTTVEYILMQVKNMTLKEFLRQTYNKKKKEGEGRGVNPFRD